MVSKLPQFADKAVFVNVLVEGKTPAKPALKADLDSWIKELSVPFTVVTDVAEAPFAAKKAWGVRETTYVLDRATMKILVRKANAALALKELEKLP